MLFKNVTAQSLAGLEYSAWVKGFSSYKRNRDPTVWDSPGETQDDSSCFILFSFKFYLILYVSSKLQQETTNALPKCPGGILTESHQTFGLQQRC